MTRTPSDFDRVPMGKHQGKRFIDVPDSYLISLWQHNKQAFITEKRKQKGADMGPHMFATMLYIEDSFTEKELE
jgi:hypothetical protein